MGEINYKELLEKTPYQELKAKFVELGIESVYKHGTKKAELIENALKALEALKTKVENTEVGTEEPIVEAKKEVPEAPKEPVVKAPSAAEIISNDVDEKVEDVVEEKSEKVALDEKGIPVVEVTEEVEDDLTVDEDKIVRPETQSKDEAEATAIDLKDELANEGEKELEKIEKESKEVKEIQEGPSKEVLEENLERINRQLKTALPTHKKILINKQNMILEMLEGMEDNS